MESLDLLKDKTVSIESGRIEYKLLRLLINDETFYLVFLSFRGESRVCTLECNKRATAEEIFDSLIKTRSTPLSLSDSIYELQK